MKELINDLARELWGLKRDVKKLREKRDRLLRYRSITSHLAVDVTPESGI
jgi:hypothetical protein